MSECRRCGDFAARAERDEKKGPEIVQAWKDAWALHKEVDEPHRVRPEGVSKWLK